MLLSSYFSILHFYLLNVLNTYYLLCLHCCVRSLQSDIFCMQQYICNIPWCVFSINAVFAVFSSKFAVLSAAFAGAVLYKCRAVSAVSIAIFAVCPSHL